MISRLGDFNLSEKYYLGLASDSFSETKTDTMSLGKTLASD